MAAKLATLLVGIALASTMLAGCGTTASVTAVKAENATTVQGKDYYTVTRAQSVAQNSLYSYDRLRDDWMRAYSDAEKDRIEDQMLVVLSQGIGDVRDAVSAEAGASGADSRRVFNIADRAIQQYEALRWDWSNTHNVHQQRVISNQMQTIMVGALKDVQRVRPGSPYLDVAFNPEVKLTNGRPTPVEL